MPGLVCVGFVQQEMAELLHVLPQPVPVAALPLMPFFVVFGGQVDGPGSWG